MGVVVLRRAWKPAPFEDVKEGIFRSLPGFNALLNERFACRLVCGDFFDGDFDFDHGCNGVFPLVDVSIFSEFSLFVNLKMAYFHYMLIFSLAEWGKISILKPWTISRNL